MKIDKPMDMAAIVATTPAAAQSAAAQGGGRSTAAAAQTPAGGRGRAAESGAGVTVSVRAHALVGLSASGGDIDMNKVEAVRAAIAQGTFSVNPEVIADRLLANARDMLGSARF